MLFPSSCLRAIKFKQLQCFLILVALFLGLWWFYSEPIISPATPCPPKWPTSNGQNRTGDELWPVSCDRVFKGDEEELKYASGFQWCADSNKISDKDYVELAKDCTAFKQRFGYFSYNVSEEEKDFPIAFSILMHEHVNQAERLLRLIYRPQNFYCIHVDQKASYAIQAAVRGITSCFENVIQPKKQVAVRWAEFTVLEAELACMEALYEQSERWKYFINLTGRDFPLKTNWELVQILKAYNGANDIDGTPHRRPIVWTLFSWRTENWRTGTLKDPAPHDFLVHKGSTHIAATRGFVHFALNDPRAMDLRDWMRDIRVPDEHFFNTLNHHPHFGVPGAYTGDPNLKHFYTRHKIWMDDKGEHKCSGRWVRFICQLGVRDLPVQLPGRPEMFVNKFYEELDPVALRCAEEWYRNRTKKDGMLREDRGRGSEDFDVEFYKNLNFANNHV